MNDFATYGDLRSAARARQRTTANLKKYYSYKALKPNQRTQLHYIVPCYLHHKLNCHECCWSELPASPDLLAEVPVRALTKREFYNEAQAWPKPPQRHHAYPKRETRWGCSRSKWWTQHEAGKVVERVLRDEGKGEMVEQDELFTEYDIKTEYARNGPGRDEDVDIYGEWWGMEWDLGNIYLDGYGGKFGLGWGNDESDEEDDETIDEYLSDSDGEESQDEGTEWDVVSCASEMSEWEEVM